MDTSHAASLDDVSALAWVQEELRKSLEATHKALRRMLRETESTFGSDVDDVEPTQLRNARQHLHQGVGVLELVGLPAGSALLRGSEAAVQRYMAKPHKMDLPAVEVIEQASFALLDYLARRLSGKPVSAVALFPQYRAVQELAGAERIHPADLWQHDWQWHALPAEPGVAPRAADAATVAEFEARTLALMRGNGPAVLGALGDLAAGLGAGAAADAPHTATLWQLAAAFFEAQADGLLVPDVYSKRLNSRLLAQLRAQQRGTAAAAERLAHDLLFFCAQARPPAAGASPRLAAVRRSFPAARDAQPVDYSVPVLGRYDPAWVAQAKKRVATAKDSWSAVAGGELHRLPGLGEQFALVADSLKRLVPGGEPLGEALSRAIAASVQQAAAPGPALAMEVATSVLYLEAALEDGSFEQPDQAARVERLAHRVQAVQGGAAPEPLEAWMEELYRRVSDRQTMGSVVQELRAALSESEKLVDQFFRKPEDTQVLIPVPGQLQAMRGVLSVLGLDQATHAVLRMRDDVEALVAGAADAVQRQPLFERLASNLSALSFLIDLLGVQPQAAKSMFRFDTASGLLGSSLGRQRGDAPTVAQVEPALIGQAQSLAAAATSLETPLADVSAELERLSLAPAVAAHSGLAASLSDAQAALDSVNAPYAKRETEARARERVADALQDFVSTASDAAALEPRAPTTTPMPLISLAPSAPVEQTGLEGDDEMQAIFLEEAGEVLETARGALAALRDAPADVEQLTTVRRAFHTLKGSSRMVGLNDYGEAGWAFEQLYNATLASQQPASTELLSATDEALGHLRAWADAIAAGRADGWRSDALRRCADLLRLEGRYLPLDQALEPQAPPASLAAALSFTLPEAGDLELPAAAPAEPAPADAALPVAEATPVAEPMPGLDFSFDLGDAPTAAPPQDGLAETAPFDADTADGDDAHAATAPMPLAELPDTVASPVEDLIATIDLDLPAELPAQQDDAAHVIEPLAATVPVAASFEALPPAADFEEGTPADEPSADDAEAVPAFVANELVEPLQPSAPDLPPPSAQAELDNEQVKLVGDLRIAIPLFNIYLNEADELSRRLAVELSEWTHELQRAVGESSIALAHSLAGSSATVGFADLSALARQLEHALMRSQLLGAGSEDDARLYLDVAEEIRRLLHQFAAGFLKAPPPELQARLAAHERDLALRVEARASAPQAAEADDDDAPQGLPFAVPAEPRSSAFGDLGQAEFKPFVPLADEPQRAASAEAFDSEEDIDAVDAVDADLFVFFEEEAQELLPQLAAQLRDWMRQPGETAHADACMRTLHTLKGGARLAGAMRLGEMAHRLETAIEHQLAHGSAAAGEVEQLLGRADGLSNAFEALRQRDALAYQAADAAAEAAARAAPTLPDVVIDPPGPAQALPAEAPPADVVAAPAGGIDWSRFAAQGAAAVRPTPAERVPVASSAAVRVRTQLLDRMVNHAGEVSIARARLEAEVGQIKGSLGDLTDNLERLRLQLRDIELQAETQMATRMEAAKAAAEAFDPLEFDRFTRFQELTRMMVESVNDVATVQRTLQRTLETAEDELAVQARLTRDLQDDLLRTRMVEFEGLSERLYRVVRQAAKETGKQVRLDILGGSIEVDRGVLDRMTGAFEHLLRNCVTHGIESAETRRARGKDPIGTIAVALHQEGNEVSVEFRDDGGGLDLARIRDKGVAMGLIDAARPHADAELANLIFMPGFTTAATVSELAGRGVGMDVVRSEVNALGGRIETASAAGQGTSFKLVLPLTTAVTQVVMLRAGAATVAVPATLVEIVRRATPAEVESAYERGAYTYGDHALPFFWLGALLQLSPRAAEIAGRSLPVVVVRSAQQRVVLHVDEVLGNQEVVVKNLGPQLSRLPGLAGMTLLASGAAALIYNPVALATVYGEAARQAMSAAQAAARSAATPLAPSIVPTEPAVAAAPTVLVVDDSLTVRRVTQRLLAREGYRVVVAKDGLEALERLAEERPSVVLSDIEMPRMDGFDLVRNIRGDARLAALPVIMITSRIAQKHRDYAAELGVNHYLGKPYSEEELLALIGRYCAAQAAA